MAIRSALITGASSGLGAALAQALAQPDTTLYLSGRDAARLEAVAATCRSGGAVAKPMVLDVRDAAGMARWIGEAGPLDLVVANAGISERSGDSGCNAGDRTRLIFEINLVGVLNTVLPAMTLMAGQPADGGTRGRIVVIASISAFMTTPDSAAYCAAKAAVHRWAAAMAPDAQRRGILITSVCPGFIRTAMTERYQFAMPGVMDADRAARIILRGVAKRRSTLVFPWWMGLAARLAGLIPPRMLAAAERYWTRPPAR